MQRGPRRPQGAPTRPGAPSAPRTVDYPLPQETRTVARNRGGECHNLGLWLDRFALYEQTGTSWTLTPQAKRREGAPLDLKAINPLLEACVARWRAMLTHYAQRGFRVEQFSVTPDWRLVVA